MTSPRMKVPKGMMKYLLPSVRLPTLSRQKAFEMERLVRQKDWVPRDRLTMKQVRFVQFYQGNATEAAKLAGYSTRNVRNIACALMKSSAVRKALLARDGVDPAELEAQAAKEIEYEKKLKVKVGSLPEGEQMVIATRLDRQAYWTKLMNDSGAKHLDRLKASELLAKSQGDFAELKEAPRSIETELKGLTDDELTERIERLERARTDLLSPQGTA